MVSKGTAQFNEPARVWPCLLIYSLIFQHRQDGEECGQSRTSEDMPGWDQMGWDHLSPRQRQAIVLDLWSVIHCQPPKLTLLRISRSSSCHCHPVTPLDVVVVVRPSSFDHPPVACILTF